VNPGCTFTHEAMKTSFTLRLLSDQADYAAKVAANCFAELDALEEKLSRYLPGSDVWQINRLQAGDSLFLSEAAYACLRTAFELYLETGGLFDITLGRKIEHFKNRHDGPAPAITGQLLLDPERPAIHCVEPGREIDLGGIGKGFALDRMRAHLQGCGMPAGLLSAGASTHLAFGEQSWTIQLPDCREQPGLDLSDCAISASGIEIQGSHLVSPRGDAQLHPYSRLWVVERDAARADAWSTACMLLSEEELNDVRKERTVYTAAP